MRWRSHGREISDPSGRAAANVIRMGISLAARCNTSTAMLFHEYVAPGSNVISLSISKSTSTFSPPGRSSGRLPTPNQPPKLYP